MQPRLYIDENLRGLARWLRFLGFDADLPREGALDKEVLAEAAGRMVWTRDRELAASIPSARYLRERKTRDQLRAVLAEIGLPPQENWFSRCVLCNRPLHEVTPDKRGSGVPGEFDRYWRCDSCSRTYWRGSHYERTRKYLLSL